MPFTIVARSTSLPPFVGATHSKPIGAAFTGDPFGDVMLEVIGVTAFAVDALLGVQQPMNGCQRVVWARAVFAEKAIASADAAVSARMVSKRNCDVWYMARLWHLYP